MTAKGHVILSFPISTGILIISKDVFFDTSFNSGFLLLFYACTVFGALLPDIDEPGSYIGRKFPIFSHIFSAFISHRGFTHFLIIPITLLIIAYTNENQILKLVLYGIAIGVFAHTCGDMFTKGGIKGFFFPFFMKRTIGLLPKTFRFYTGSIIESIFIVVLLILSTYLLFYIDFTKF